MSGYNVIRSIFLQPLLNEKLWTGLKVAFSKSEAMLVWPVLFKGAVQSKLRGLIDRLKY